MIRGGVMKKLAVEASQDGQIVVYRAWWNWQVIIHYELVILRPIC